MGTAFFRLTATISIGFVALGCKTQFRVSEEVRVARDETRASAEPRLQVSPPPPAAVVPSPASPALAPRSLWNTAYYAGWQSSVLPPSAIDYSAITHLVIFSAFPRADGSLDTAVNGLSNLASTDLLARARSAGTKVIVSIGGAGSIAAMRLAAAPAVRATLVASILALVNNGGYDGVDIDWEPLEAGDVADYEALLQSLRAGLGSKLLITAVPTSAPIASLKRIQTVVDQINLMTYDLSGAYPGWVVWHNSPLYSGATEFPGGGNVPSIDETVKALTAAGVNATKLGIGIDFYGYSWTGGTGTSTGGATIPGQTWTGAPTVNSTLSYAQIKTQLWQNSAYRWDSSASAPFLSFDAAGSSSDRFVSFDDEQSIAEKAKYARQNGIGGLIVWELGGAYFPSAPAGQRDPLLQAIKTALKSRN